MKTKLYEFLHSIETRKDVMHSTFGSKCMKNQLDLQNMLVTTLEVDLLVNQNKVSTPVSTNSQTK